MRIMDQLKESLASLFLFFFVLLRFCSERRRVVVMGAATVFFLLPSFSFLFTPIDIVSHD